MVAVHEAPPEARDRRPGSTGAASRVPALDGLRGFALVGMLLWHAEVSWVQGGFARMTIFFALSGYLATMSWQRVRLRRGGRGGFGTFWWRRARRLLPVSFLGIGFAIAVTVLTGTDTMRERLGGDVLSVLGYVSNLRFWLTDQGYGELFSEASLLQHYWTLSIEEQAFIVLPLLLAGVALLCGTRHRRAAVLVGVLAVACAGLPAVVHHSPDGVWYSSIVRFGEFASGVALALWTFGEPARKREVPRWLLPAAGTVSLATLVAVMLTIPRDAEWLFRGGMALVVIPTVALLAAASRGVGLGSRILATMPLVRLGRWTFSIYVLHWPLFWLFNEPRTGLDGWELATVRLVVAVAVGAVVHVLIERPLMAPGPAVPEDLHRQEGLVARIDHRLVRLVPTVWWRSRAAASVLVVAGSTLALVSMVPSGADADERIQFDYFDDLEVPADTEVTAPTAPEAGDEAAEGPPEPFTVDLDNVDAESVALAEFRMEVPDQGRIAVGVYGGSVATVLDGGGVPYKQASDEIFTRPGVTWLGCGLVNEGVRVTGWDEVTWSPSIGRPPERCATWQDTWPYVAHMTEIDVALVVLGTWDTYEFDLDGIGTTRVGEPEFDALLEEHLETMLDGFRRAGVEQVQLTTTPVLGGGEDGRAWQRRGAGDDHPERVAAYNAVQHRFADRHDDVAIIELAEALGTWSDEDQARYLPDGLHYTPAGAERMWQEFLGRAVVEAYDGR